MNSIKARISSFKLEYIGSLSFSIDINTVESFSYADKSSGESDSISIEIYDRSRNWLNKHFPQKGHKMKASINCFDGAAEKILNCGQFTLDDISISGEPLSVSLKAVSSPVSTGFSVTERSKVWKNLTIKSIASDIAKRAGIRLYYDADDIRIASVEQSSKTDSSFLSELCKDYGICMKVYSDRLVLYSLQKAINKTPVKTIDKTEMESWNFNTTLAGNYTGGQLTYSNSAGNDINYSIGNGSRILKITNKKPANFAEAERMMNAAILFANLETTTLSFSTQGQLDIVSSQNIKVTGIGKEINGIYHILSVSHQISSGFTTSIEAAKVG